ncbi:response regulator [Deinococcus sp. JMULE3]|uniref:response regulator n=1 Tax=Deinococcus sp. JMULE3 TaxID=2518341 RepID=UPI001575E990|nr:response regulator [Deinococcus sp. JMULE3]
MPLHEVHALSILLVDDNPTDCELAGEAFAATGQAVRLYVLHDSAEVLPWLRDHGVAGLLPDVVVLDLNMPGLNGLDLLGAIRAAPEFRYLPVVILSSSAHPDDVDRAYDLIVTSYLIKHPSFTEFIAQIEDFVRYWQRSRFRTPPVLTT